MITQLCSTGIRVTKSANTRNAYAKISCAKSTWTRVAFVSDTDVRSANTKSTSVQGVYTRDTCFSDVCIGIDTCSGSFWIRAANIWDTGGVSTRDVYVEGPYFKSTFVGGACTKSICIRGTGIVKH